jgi:hypothetical protein
MCVCVCECVSVRHCCHKTRAHPNVSQEVRSSASKLYVETILGSIHLPIQEPPVVMRSRCDLGHYLFRRTRGDLPPSPVCFHDLYRLLPCVFLCNMFISSLRFLKHARVHLLANSCCECAIRFQRSLALPLPQIL